MDTVDNPPAFPTHFPAGSAAGLGQQGMSLRDYLAAKAMEAFTGNMVINDRMTPRHLRATALLEALPDIAEISFAMADAMLKARKA